MDYTITIPDELTAGIVAVSYLEGVTPEQVVAAHAISAATKICQDMKVGPYYEGPTPPRFNPDGTPYSPGWAPPVAEEEVVELPAAIEPEIVFEPEMEADAEASIEPATQVNDTTGEGDV